MSSVFVFGRLKSDLEKFQAIILEERPDHILGVAATRRASRVEPITINRFGKSGTIQKGALETLSLYVPDYLGTEFIVASRPTSSFCNWTMYKVENFINENGLNTKLSFIHLNIKDVNRLVSVAKPCGRYLT